MKWRLNENSKIIVPRSETSNWYLFNGKSFEQITPTVNGGNLEFTVSKNKAIVSLIRTNFDVLDTTQLYGKIKSERILSNLKISNNINAHRVTGENLLTDGSFEQWDDANHLTHWNESTSGSSTVNQESTDVVDGNYAVRLDVDRDNNHVGIYQIPNLTAGIYRFTVLCKINGGVGRIRLARQDTYDTWNPATHSWSGGFAAFFNTEWATIEIIFNIETDVTVAIWLERLNASSQSIYFDNARLEKIGVIEQYDARGGLKVVSDGTSIKKYAIDSQSSKQAKLDKVWM